MSSRPPPPAGVEGTNGAPRLHYDSRVKLYFLQYYSACLRSGSTHVFLIRGLARLCGRRGMLAPTSEPTIRAGLAADKRSRFFWWYRDAASPWSWTSLRSPEAASNDREQRAPGSSQIEAEGRSNGHRDIFRGSQRITLQGPFPPAQPTSTPGSQPPPTPVPGSIRLGCGSKRRHSQSSEPGGHHIDLGSGLRPGG